MKEITVKKILFSLLKTPAEKVCCLQLAHDTAMLILYFRVRDYDQTTKGRIDNPSNQAFEGVKFIKIVNSSNIFGKSFLTSKFLILVSLLVNKIYSTKNKHLLGTYAVVNQVSLRSNEMIHMLVT